MKFTKKCNNNTKNKIRIRKKLDKQRDRRRSSAGMFYTSSAGAVTSLILMLAFSFVFNIIGVNTNNTYADSINLSIDTDNLVLNFLPSSSAGTFSASSNANISVSTTSASGYTLSIASSSNNTSLTNSSDSSTISSIESAIDESTFSNSANTTYNNKWGYKPSSIYNSSTEQNTSNSNFRPLPGSSGEILAVTSAANSTANNYTLSFGARVNSSTSVGTYSNNTYIITAVANVAPLTIIYNANGGYFGSNTSTITNTVDYDATCTTGTVTRYSHTSNIDDAGTASGTYPASQATKDVVTIPGASELSVHIYYSTYQGSSSSRRSYVYAFTGEYTGTISSSTSGYLKRYYGGTATTMAGATQDTFTVTGDTVTFGFYSTSSSTRYYGYYAVVTGSGTTCSKTAVSGGYTNPTRTGATFLGWSEDQNASSATYANESKISSNLQAVNGDSNVTLYAVWNAPGQCTSVATCIQTITNCPITATTVTDARDGKTYKIQQLADDNCWMLDNLALNPVTVSLANLKGNTNASDTALTYLKNGGGTSPYTDTAVSSSWSNSYNTPRINASSINTVPSNAPSDSLGSNKVGVYYNYCAASAGSYCYTDSAGTGNASEDLCPIGWHMPTSGDSGEYGALYADNFGSGPRFRTNLSTPFSGYFVGSSASNQGTSGYFWSSDGYNNREMHSLYVASDGVGLGINQYRYYGFSIRCIKKNETPAMQDQTSSTLANLMPNVGDSTTLADVRDGRKYIIAKLADGNYWMLDNLRLGGVYSINLTPNDTNITSNWTLPASGTANFTSSTGYTTAAINAEDKNTTVTSYGSGSGKVGNYYNYCAASAGTYCYASGSGTGNASHDICPKGWRMPTGGDSGEYGNLYTTYSSNATNFINALSTPLSGYFSSNGLAYDQDDEGYFWSSTRSDGSNMYRLRVDNGSYVFSSSSYNYRYYGYSVRCLFDL